MCKSSNFSRLARGVVFLEVVARSLVNWMVAVGWGSLTLSFLFSSWTKRMKTWMHQKISEAHEKIQEQQEKWHEQIRKEHEREIDNATKEKIYMQQLENTQEKKQKRKHTWMNTIEEIWRNTSSMNFNPNQKTTGFFPLLMFFSPVFQSSPACPLDSLTGLFVSRSPFEWCHGGALWLHSPTGGRFCHGRVHLHHVLLLTTMGTSTPQGRGMKMTLF